MRSDATMGHGQEGRSAIRRWHDAAVGHHLLVALIFTGCLPFTLARSLAGRAEAPPLGQALDTARAAAAQALSFPG